MASASAWPPKMAAKSFHAVAPKGALRSPFPTTSPASKVGSQATAPSASEIKNYAEPPIGGTPQNGAIPPQGVAPFFFSPIVPIFPISPIIPDSKKRPRQCCRGPGSRSIPISDMALYKNREWPGVMFCVGRGRGAFRCLRGLSSVEGACEVAQDADAEEPVEKDGHQHQDAEPQPQAIDLTGGFAVPFPTLGPQTLGLHIHFRFASFTFLAVLVFFNVSILVIHSLKF